MAIQKSDAVLLWSEWREADSGMTYTRWLEKRLVELKRVQGLQEMGAEQTVQLWRDAEQERDRLRVAVDYLRDWLSEEGLTRALRVLDGQLD